MADVNFAMEASLEAAGMLNAVKITAEIAQIDDPQDYLNRRCFFCHSNTGDFKDIRAHLFDCPWAKAREQMQKWADAKHQINL